MNKYRRKVRVAAGAGFGKGWSAGYSDYRYGPKSPIRLAEPAIFNSDKRDHLVKSSAALMREWTFNRWENEAPIRHGLRTGLVLQGHGWARSDDAAADIVKRALNRLGRGVETRPDDDTASFGHDDRERCAVCYAPLDRQSVAMGLRYCSAEHAQWALKRREYADGWYNSELGYAAYRMVLRERNEARECEQCKRLFKPMDLKSTQKFCSATCKAESQKIELPPRVCELFTCEEVFTPTARNPGQRYCCHEHSLVAKRTVGHVHCARPGCGETFKPKKNAGHKGGRQSAYCSRECSDAMRSEAKHRLACECCGEPFEAAMPNAQYCCEAHRQIVRKIARGTPPARLSPGVFDYMLKVAA